MGGREAPRRLLAAFLIAASVLAAVIPSISAAAPASPSKKPRASVLQPPAVPAEDGRRLTSSAVFPVAGDVYPNGMFYVTMYIGDPPKPYYFDVDTGSDLTWLQCDAPCVSCWKGPHPLYKPRKGMLVPCNHPLCSALHSLDRREQTCKQCDYEIQYADKASSLGVLVADTFGFALTNSSHVRPVLAFGCGYDQEVKGNVPTTSDGVLGLGSGKVSVLSQLSGRGVTKNVVGHCLGAKGGGFVFFGDDLVPKSRVAWAPMSRAGQHRNHYSPGPADLYLGTNPLGQKMEVVLDSGSSYTYFAAQPYEAFVSDVKNDLAKKPLKQVVDDKTLPLCWKGQKPFKSVNDVKKYFKTLTLNFVNGKRTLLEIPPENYLIITEHGNACLGILNGTEAGLNDLNIIGDISMLDLMVVYDNQKQQIGWIHAACDRLPNADDNYGDRCSIPQLTAMGGILTEECTYYQSKK